MFSISFDGFDDNLDEGFDNNLYADFDEGEGSGCGRRALPKEVVVVQKLLPIPQPTREREERQMRMGRRQRQRMGNYPDSSYVTPLRRPKGGMRTPARIF